MAISLQLVEMMGGTIQVTSTYGKGSRFWFDLELPVASDWASAARVVELGTIVGYKGQRRKILVVDDKDINRAVVVEVLKSLEFECAEAVNGEEGLTVARQFRPDLILTDLVMPVVARPGKFSDSVARPGKDSGSDVADAERQEVVALAERQGLDGFEMTRRLRQIPQLKNTVIIASSASVLPEDQYNCLDAGCNDFLPKPIDLEQLLVRLEQYLQLEWIYEEGTQEATPEDISENGTGSELIPPPEEVLVKVYEAARIGDIEVVEKEAEAMKELGDRYHSFAKRLLELAAEFEDKKIMKLVEMYLSNYTPRG
ncbi:MAG: response regulator [Okeania sp. SIO2H7]|nr:response regulator [Okeania sp. SIO2H7]